MADIKRAATREGYAAGLLELGLKYQNMYVLDADLAGSTMTGVFGKAYPERHFNCGIAEQNMIGIASGLALSGNIVFASSFAMFASERCCEQIRNSVCYPKLNVKIGASHGGISVGEDGASHQCCEDIAIMRALPNMTIINPADITEARMATIAAAQLDGPVYLRFGRLTVPQVFGDDHRFEIGKGDVLSEGDNVTIIATGLMVERAIAAGELLAAEGISAQIVNIATIKPIDRELVIECAEKTGAIVTAEEHSIIGGLGGAVCETVCDSYPVPVERVGIEDRFGVSGPALELLEMFGLNAQNIAAKAKRAIERKNNR